jgi:hypothetical protein
LREDSHNAVLAGGWMPWETQARPLRSHVPNGERDNGHLQPVLWMGIGFTAAVIT